MKKMLLLVCICLFPVTLWANDVLYSALKNGIGIRALSMGTAFTALAEGCEGLYYNPAGLVNPGFAFKYENLDYKKSVYPQFDYYSFYFSPLAFNHFVKVLSDNTSAEINAISYVRTGTNGSHWGLTYKAITTDLGAGKQNGWSTDIGILMNVNDFLNIGVAGQDIFSSSSLNIPYSFRGGVAFFNKSHTFIATTDLLYQKDTNINLAFGVEYEPAKGLIIRGGALKDNFTAGLGLRIGLISADAGVIIPQQKNGERIYMLGMNISNIDFGLNRSYVFN